MERRRIAIALTTATVISGAFTLLFARMVSHAGGSHRSLHYVAASKALEAGDRLSRENLRLVNWPTDAPLQGAYTDLKDAEGKSLLYPIAEGEPVLDRQLAAAGSGLPARIPPGMRAVSLKSNEVVGVAGYLLPGAHVDVLATLHTPDGRDTSTSTVVQDVQVLTAGEKMQADPEGKATRVDVVTLLMNPEDAEKAVLASTQGTIHFVLRSGADHNHTEGEPIQLTTLSGAGRPLLPTTPKAAPVHAARPAHDAPSSRPRYTVEVVRGDKGSMETF